MSWFKKKEILKDELYIRDIVKQFSEKPNVEIFVSPNGNNNYILDRENKIHLRVDYLQNRIDISNHNFLYKKSISSEMSKTLTEIIREAKEKELSLLDKELFQNEVDLLRKIINIDKKEKNE